jgi:hypothetical protein
LLAFGLSLGAVLVISAVSATFSRLFSGFMAGVRVLFLDFLQFQLLFLDFSPALWLGFGKLFWGFLQFQLLFSGFSPAFELGLWCCFGDFCSFSYFLRDFWHNGGSPTT